MNTTRIGIMQPYFFPYIGYWQLMSYVDRYVIYDDVNYIKGGWINRNRILINGVPSYINLPLSGVSSNKQINQISVDKTERDIRKLTQMLRLNYCKAPNFDEAFPFLCKLIALENDNLGDYLSEVILAMADYLGIKTEIIRSSDLKIDSQLKGVDRVIAICKKLDGKEYVNAIGGAKLYSRELFRDKGIDLKFLKTDKIIYKQMSEGFEENLSIIDVIMNNNKGIIKEMLSMYELV